MSKLLINKLLLKQKLYGLKLQEGSDLQQHVNALNQIISDLARLDVKNENEDKTCIMLCFLPSYEHLGTTLMYGKNSINLDVIQAALMFTFNRDKMQWRVRKAMVCM